MASRALRPLFPQQSAAPEPPKELSELEKLQAQARKKNTKLLGSKVSYRNKLSYVVVPSTDKNELAEAAAAEAALAAAAAASDAAPAEDAAATPSASADVADEAAGREDAGLNEYQYTTQAMYPDL